MSNSNNHEIHKDKKIPFTISRLHYIDLTNAVLNNPNYKRIFDKLERENGFNIIEKPKPSQFLDDLSIFFLYQH